MAQAAPAEAAELTVVYAGNLNGEMEPCGCSEGSDLGGILRRATLLDRLRAARPDLVALSNGGLLAWDRSSDAIKNSFILAGLAALGYDAVGVQWRDLASGPELLTDSGLPLVASNWLNGELPRERSIRRPAARLAYFQWLDPAGAPQQAMQGSHLPVATGTERLAEALAKARAAGAITVLGSELPPERAAAALPLELVDILLAPNEDERFAEPERIGTTLVLRPGIRGQRLGILTLSLDAERRIAGWRHEVRAMPSSIPKSERLASWYAAYNAAMRADYERRVAARAAIDGGRSPYRGAKACKDCHAGAYAAWRASRHAEAHDRLAAVDKAFDPNCLTCHTVGFLEPGGFLDTLLTGHLADVQCESCHGPAAAHADSGGEAPTPNADAPPQAACAACHDRDHSPAFVFDGYWPHIAHGKEPG